MSYGFAFGECLGLEGLAKWLGSCRGHDLSPFYVGARPHGIPPLEMPFGHP